MFHGKQFEERIDRAANRAGLRPTDGQRSLLGRYAEWLATEGRRARVIGPGETERLVDRHIADSLVFASAWEDAPDDLLDVGSGAGLPGIPLAVTHPAMQVTLLDRSGKRCGLARRAVRVLGLTNVTVQQGDVGSLSGGWSVVVFRASLPPEEALDRALPLLLDHGCAVVALSRSAAPDGVPRGPDGGTVDLLEIEKGVLDSPAWLLRMTPTRPSTPNGPSS